MVSTPDFGGDPRRINDRHDHRVPVAVLLFLAIVAYLWSDLSVDHPPPGIELLKDNSFLGQMFSDDGQLRSEAWIHHGNNALSNSQERLALLVLAGIGFLLSYYLPLAMKRGALVLVTLAGIALVMGPRILGLLLLSHMVCYVTFHPRPPNHRSTISGICLFALLLPLAWVGGGWTGFAESLITSLLLAPLVFLFYAHIYRPLLGGAARSWLQPLVTQSSLIVVGSLTLANWGTGSSLSLPMGVVLFFLQWERLFMYQIDLKDGRVPEGLSLRDYLATFFSPAVLVNFPWLSRIPMGYSYLNNSFLARDKNRIVLSGIKLIALSVAFFALGPMVRSLLIVATQGTGPDVITGYRSLLDAPSLGPPPGILTVWSVLIDEFLRFYFVWSAIAHLKVGLWRLFGYDIEPYFQLPFLSTNLVEFWRRYSYYYRAFLVQAFYYPVFLRCFKQKPMLRIFTATLAAACVGNFIYHLVFQLLMDGYSTSVLLSQFRTLPYYVILGLAISFTQIWLIKRGRRTRRPWTFDRRLGLDVLAVCGTIGFFILIRPLHHVPAQGTILEGLRLCISAFGIQI